jgi:hypothetical protein
MFLETCAREGWLDVPDKRLIYSEDFPKLNKSQPRYIPLERCGTSKPTSFATQ